MTISSFDTHKSTALSGTTTIDAYLNAVQYGKWQDLISNARIAKHTGKDAEYKRLKVEAGGVMCHGQFETRSQGTLIKHSGFVCLDIDHLGTDLPAKRAAIQSNRHTYACHVSMGGDGLCVWVKVKAKANGDDHLHVYDHVASHYSEMYGVVCDPAAANIGKCRAYSYDPDLYQNANADEYRAPAKVVAPPKEYKTVFTDSDFDDLLKQIRDRGLNLCGNYFDWVNTGLALAEEFGEGGRDYFHILSQQDAKYNERQVNAKYNSLVKAGGAGRKVTIGSLFYLCKQHGLTVTSQNTQQVVALAQQVKRSGGNAKDVRDRIVQMGTIEATDALIDQAMALPVAVAPDLTIDDQVVLYLKTNYSIRFNKIKGQLEVDGNPIGDRTFNDMWLAIRANVSDKVSDKVVQAILNSSHFEAYDFVADYFATLPDKPVTKDTAELTYQLAASIGGDAKQTAYNFEFLVRWGTAFCYQALATEGMENSLMLVLTGPLNSGKTSFIRQLLPIEWTKYRKDKIQGGTEKDESMEPTAYALVFDDEFDATSKKDVAQLKAKLSQQDIKQRRVYGRFEEVMPRRASYAGTSNESELIADPHGNRRLIPIACDQMRWDLYNAIDKRDLLTEWVNLYRSGWDFRLTQNEIDLLNKVDVNYRRAFAEEEALDRYFKPATNFNSFACLKLTNTDILAELQTYHIGMRFSGKILGTFLKKRGYSKIGNKYLVERVPQDPITQQTDAPF